jgi:hypothetical protein
VTDGRQPSWGIDTYYLLAPVARRLCDDTRIASVIWSLCCWSAPDDQPFERKATCPSSACKPSAAVGVAGPARLR